MSKESKEENLQLCKNFLEMQSLAPGLIAIVERNKIHIVTIDNLSPIKILVHNQNNDDKNKCPDQIAAVIKTPENILVSIGTQTIKFWNFETFEQLDCIAFPDDFPWRPALISDNPPNKLNDAAKFVLLADGNIIGIFQELEEGPLSIFKFNARFENRNQLNDKKSYIRMAHPALGFIISNFSRANNTLAITTRNSLLICDEKFSAFKENFSIDGPKYDHTLFFINDHTFLKFHIRETGWNFASKYEYDKENNNFVETKQFDILTIRNLPSLKGRFYFSSYNPQLNEDNTITFILSFKFIWVSHKYFSCLATLNLETLICHLEVGIPETIHSFIKKSEKLFYIRSEQQSLSYKLDSSLTRKALDDTLSSMIFQHTKLIDPLIKIVMEYIREQESQEFIAAKNRVIENIFEAFNQDQNWIDINDFDKDIRVMDFDPNDDEYQNRVNEDYIGLRLKLKSKIISVKSKSDIERELMATAKDIRNNYKDRIHREHHYRNFRLYKEIKQTLRELNSDLELNSDSETVEEEEIKEDSATEMVCQS